MTETTHHAPERPSGVVMAGLYIAAIVMFLAAASMLALALVGTGRELEIRPDMLAVIGLALVLAASGVEMLRRRHFWFVLSVPALLAGFNLVYAIATGTSQALATVAIYAVATLLVWVSRTAFDVPQ